MFFPEAARILGTSLDLPNPAVPIESASIDTRTISRGNLFVALRGAQSDGHLHLEDAFKKGASGAILLREFYASHKEKFYPGSVYQNLILTDDPEKAFAVLASAYCGRFNLKKLAVVGSVGKTSTKEFLAYALRRKYPTLATEGNLNNHLGLPLTLFRLRKEHQFAVCELGTNHLGDIKQLAEILAPDAGLLTRITPEHLEGFGSLDNVYEGELELFAKLPQNAPVVIPDDDPVLAKKAARFPLRYVKTGLSDSADYRVTDISVSGSRVRFKVNGHSFSFPGLATFLARNAAMAIAAAVEQGVDWRQIEGDWEDFKTPAGRFQEQVVESGYRFINDGYNASPAAFEAALDSFRAVPADGRKILVFSDMLELGSEEKKYHEELGKQIARSGVDHVIAYGPRSKWAVQALQSENSKLPVDYVESSKAAADFLEICIRPGDAVLFKASRGMKIEEVAKYFLEKIAGSIKSGEQVPGRR